MANFDNNHFTCQETLPDKQRGVVVPIVAIGLLAILAVAGLALDSSHALANKTRIQNTVDAAALAAAKVLDDSTDTTMATAAAFNLFALNASGSGNHELNNAYGGGEITVTVQFSTTVNPFTPGSPTGPFVRVLATGFETETTLSRVLGVNEIPTPATAVAGPSGPLGIGPGSEVCDIAPIAVCPPDGGFKEMELVVLKPGPGNHGEIGPGNYKMLRMDCNGGSCLRRNIAGSFDKCATVGGTVETEPGVSSGPTSQGFNTRFKKYKGGGMNAEDYPPDRVLTEQDPSYLKVCDNDDVDPIEQNIYLIDGNDKNYCKDSLDPDDQVTRSDDIIGSGDDARTIFNYEDYKEASKGEDYDFPYGSAKNRRVLSFPKVNCTENDNGQSTLTVTGFACFFMLQSLESGQSAGAGRIIGEFVKDCTVNGSGSSNPGAGGGPLLYKIQLYKNPDSVDS